MEEAARSYLPELYTEEVYRLPRKATVAIPVVWSELSDEHRLLLKKILESIGIQMAAVKIVTAPLIDEQHPASWGASELFIFGSATRPEVNAYSWTTFADIPTLRCDSLGLLDDTRKKSLWGALKDRYRR